MKKLVVLLMLLLASPVYAGEYVNGYWKDTNHDGVKDAYVQPYYRASPDNSRLNNYSTQGNYNPYTGQAGTVNPYPQYNPYQYNYQAPVYPAYPNNRSLYR